MVCRHHPPSPLENVNQFIQGGGGINVDLHCLTRRVQRTGVRLPTGPRPPKKLHPKVILWVASHNFVQVLSVIFVLISVDFISADHCGVARLLYCLQEDSYKWIYWIVTYVN